LTVGEQRADLDDRADDGDVCIALGSALHRVIKANSLAVEARARTPLDIRPRHAAVMTKPQKPRVEPSLMARLHD
jgi:hypothetical protein